MIPTDSQNTTRRAYRNYWLLGLLFFIASIVVHYFEVYSWYRGLRGVVTFFFLFIILKESINKQSIWTVLFLIFYGFSSILTIGYENKWLATAAMLFNCIAYLFLLFPLYKKVNFQKMNLWLTIVFLLLMGINGYLLYTFVTSLESLAHDIFHYGAIVLGAMELIVLAFLALLYNYVISNKNSLIFIGFVFTLIFGEVFRGLAYYDFGLENTAVYLARALVIIAMIFFTIYSLTDKKKEELFSNL